MRWEDSSLAVGAASILLPSAAEGSCPVELGNPPILALTLLRHKGCTVLRIGSFLLHQCGALKSLASFSIRGFSLSWTCALSKQYGSSI